MEGHLLPATQTTWDKHTVMSFSLTEVVSQQWKQIAQQHDMKDDCTVAAFLLRCYQSQGSGNQAWCCQTCSSPLSQFCSFCFTLTPKQLQQTNSIQFKAETDPEEFYSLLRNSASLNKGGNAAGEYGDSTDNDDENHSSQFDSTGVEVGVKFEEDFNSGQRGVVVEAKEGSLAGNVSGSVEPLETFVCDLCLQAFPDPDLLVVHMQEHSDEMLHQCGECKARFFQQHVLKLHTKTHSQKKKYPCDQCDVFMSRLDNLNRHKALVHSKRNEGTHPDGNSAQEEESLTSKGAVDKFTCEQCKKGFARRDNYKRHLLTHSGEKRFGCQQCGAAFAYLNKLVTHTRLHSRQKPFQCGKCGKCFTESASMTKHACRPAEPKHQCRVCEKTFASSSQLILHSRLHLGKNGTSQTIPDDGASKSSDKNGERLKNQNTRCSVKTRSRTKAQTPPRRGSPEWESKRKSRNGESKSTLPSIPPDQRTSQANTVALAEEKSHPHCCQFCGARFLFQSHLTRHLQKHTGEKAFKCSQCPVSCRSLARLQIHLRSHSATKDFPCQYCGKVLRSAYALKLHLCSHTGEKPFKCEECGECFTHKAKYNDHMDVHAGERRHLCPYCGKSFLRSSNLSGHIRIHTHTKKVYPCQYCGRVLRSRNTHREHLRSHTGEKPFRCDQCGASFMRSGTYKTHLRSKHSGVRPHLCSFCGKAFLHPCHLRVHARMHTGEKPYKCSQCPKAFSILASLKEHTRKHTGDKPFKCSVCGKGFAKSCNRLAHFRTHSKDKDRVGALGNPRPLPPPPPPPPLSLGVQSGVTVDTVCNASKEQ